MNKLRHTYLIFLLIITTQLSAQYSDLNQIGTSVANFLKIGAGGRATAMGNSFVALSDDASAAYWNPGGLSIMPYDETIVQVTNWLADTKYYFLSTTFSLGDYARLAISATSFTSGEMEETTIYEPEGTGRKFVTSNMQFGFSLARSFTDRFSAGITLKYITESLDRTSASTLALDIGSIFITNILNEMRIGIAISNLGGRMRLDGSDLAIQYLPDNSIKYTNASLMTEEWDVPLLFRFGLATDAIKSENLRLTISADLIDTRDYEYRINTGIELGFKEILFLRGGYKFNYSLADYSFGFGLNLENVVDFKIKADYSYNNYGVLNNVHSFSISIGY